MTRHHKRAVILGAGGFIGINLAQALAAAGHELVCFSRSPCAHWPAGTQGIIGDLRDMPDALMATLDDAVVFHLIGSSRPDHRTGRAADELVSEVATTLRYLEQTRDRRLRWVFVSSGGTVYGPEAICPIREDAPTNPICSYGLVKLMLEKYFALYRLQHHTDYVVARLSNPYGAWQDPTRGQGLVTALVYKALRGERVEIWGDGQVVRDYLHVDDAVRALLALAAHGEAGGTYNVGSGEGRSINGLIELVGSTLGLVLQHDCSAPRAFDVSRNVLDTTRLRSLTGWRPELDMANGITATARWMINQGMVNQ